MPLPGLGFTTGLFRTLETDTRGTSVTDYAALIPFAASETQRYYLEMLAQGHTIRGLAKELGKNESSIRITVGRVAVAAAQRGYSPDYDMTRAVPDGYRVSGVSTLYNGAGQIVQQWNKSVIDRERQLELMQEAIDALCEEIKPLKASNPPKSSVPTLMSAYPVGDHHIGMLAWHEETGADYDTPTAEKLLIGAMDYLVDAAPSSKVGAVILLGDFLHYDSFESVTPQNRNQLDSDGRYPRMVRAAMRTVRYAISRALEKHQEVRVIVASGNHDPSSMAFLREALSCLYENDPRVSVDRSPTAFHYLTFGNVMIGVHHGDRTKPESLPLVMAADRPQDWGQTKHRYCFTGHTHVDRMREIGGVKVESFRILPPQDAWAYNNGYRAGREMKRIDFHHEHGEVSRQTVTPDMLA